MARSSNVTGARYQDQASSNDLESLDAYSRAVSFIVQKVAPSVVSVAVYTPGTQAEPRMAGSGTVIAPDGYILTNHHVIGQAQAIFIRFTDDKLLQARIVGIDPATDLGVLQVTGSGLPYAPLGDSSTLRPGHFVIAIGNPLGFDSTVSTGVVSSLGRALRSQDGRLIENVIQHTAPLNPGNSGGPLLNSHAEVIGLNTAIIALTQGIGFSIPSSTAGWAVSQILAHGYVPRGYLGIVGTLRPLHPQFVRFHRLSSTTAVEVGSVDPGGPAARAGVTVGDLIVRIADQDVASIDDLHRFLTQVPFGQQTLLMIIRGRDRMRLPIVPIEAPRN